MDEKKQQQHLFILIFHITKKEVAKKTKNDIDKNRSAQLQYLNCFDKILLSEKSEDHQKHKES